MTITISSNEPSTIDRILHLLRREKVPFVYEPEPLDADELKTEAIRERLRLKYVVTDTWSKMTDEERIDASLFESMLYDDDNDCVEVLNPEEQNAFRNEMKSWAIPTE